MGWADWVVNFTQLPWSCQTERRKNGTAFSFFWGQGRLHLQRAPQPETSKTPSNSSTPPRCFPIQKRFLPFNRPGWRRKLASSNEDASPQRRHPKNRFKRKSDGPMPGQRLVNHFSNCLDNYVLMPSLWLLTGTRKFIHESKGFCLVVAVRGQAHQCVHLEKQKSMQCAMFLWLGLPPMSFKSNHSLERSRLNESEKMRSKNPKA